MALRDIRSIPTRKRPTCSRGFTLLELITAVAVVGILVSVGVPSFFDVIRNNRAATNANALVSALSIARSEAIRRAARVTVCRSANTTSCGGTWSDGWIVFVDGAATDTATPVVSEVLGVWRAPAGNAVVTTTANWVRFLPRGNARTNVVMPVSYNIQFASCTGLQGRNIELNPIGRTTVERVACS